MNGPEHYAEAERLLEAGEYDETYDKALVKSDIARAQVHATLALAAATALFLPLDPATERRPVAEDAWIKVAGTESTGGAS